MRFTENQDVGIIFCFFGFPIIAFLIGLYLLLSDPMPLTSDKAELYTKTKNSATAIELLNYIDNHKGVMVYDNVKKQLEKYITFSDRVKNNLK